MTRPSRKARLRRTALIIASTAAFFAAVLLVHLSITDPVIDAVTWSPPPLPSPTPSTTLTAEAVRGQAEHPEDAAIDLAGHIYVGTEDGAIVRMSDTVAEVFAAVGGRPLGLAFDHAGNLLVCNHPLGLQRISPTGKVALLTRTADGVPIHFANDLAVASDGVIYFSDSTDKYHFANGFKPPFGAYDMLEARPRGRLLRYDPRDGSTAVLADGLYFPNGVALSADKSVVLFCETFRYRVRQLDLATGNLTTVIDNLPGYPDGLSRDSDTGLYWIGMGVRRSPLGDWVQHHSWIKNQITKFPQSWWQRISPEAVIMAIDERGHVKHTLHDATGSAGLVTNALPHGDFIYLGNLDLNHITRAKKPLP